MFQLKGGISVDIRRITASDFEAVRDFIRLFSTENIFTNQYPGQPDIERERSVAAYDNPAHLFLGAFLPDGQLVGMASFQRPKSDHPWVGHNAGFGLCILEAYTNQGLGTTLLHLLEEGARSAGVLRLFGSVRSENLRAIHLYLKNGFEIEGCARRAAFINHRWHDEYYIAKWLGE